MTEYVTTVTRRGQVTIPGELRKPLKIQPKDKVAFRLVDGQVLLRPIKSAVLASYGSVKFLRPGEKPIEHSRPRREVEDETSRWGGVERS